MTSIVKYSVDHIELSDAILKRFKQCYNVGILPFHEARVTVELKCGRHILNAIRRSLIDESYGIALDAGEAVHEFYTEKYFIKEFTMNRIELIPIYKPLLESFDKYEKLKFVLDVENKSSELKSVFIADMRVVEGSLKEPIFNPTFEIARLQPGARIYIKDIKLTIGYGNKHAKYTLANNVSFTHLDLEQHTFKELQNGPLADLSGYKLQSTESNPTHHKLFFTAVCIKNDDDAKFIYNHACNNLVNRLRNIWSSLSSDEETNVIYNINKLENNIYQNILIIPDETTTIGELIRCELFDKVVSIQYDIENSKLTVEWLTHDSDSKKKFEKVINGLISDIESLTL